MNAEILINKAIYRPWPIVLGNKIYGGSKFSIPSSCNAACYLQARNNKCKHGFKYYKKNILGDEFIVGGVCDDESSIQRNIRHLAKGRAYTESSIDEWILNVESLIGAGNSKVERNGNLKNDAIDILRPLHEISRWSNQILTMARKMISKNPNEFENKFEEAGQEKKAILKAAELLVDSFDTLSIYLNPESAGYGKKRPTEVYKLIHKIAIILGYAEGGANNKKIKMIGKCTGKYDVYESFKVMPLCLLQNAIKYSSGRDIEVSFEENNHGVNVEISSYGAIIEHDELGRIFEKGFRGKWASKMHHEGMGVGLYTSKIVADVHGFDLLVSHEPANCNVSGVPQGMTKFSLRIPFVTFK